MRLLIHLFALALLPILLVAPANSVGSAKAVASTKLAAPPVATTAAVSLRTPTACAVTLANGNSPPGERPGPPYHGVNGLWTTLYEDGKIVFGPAGPGSIEPDGSLGVKFWWWRGVRGSLTIEGRRLDATAPPLRANVPGGYGEIGFQSSGIIFPTEGCWEVTGRVADVSLTFVTQAIKSNPLANVSAASFSGTVLATEAITAAFGTNLASTVETANTLPLPTTLAGVRVVVRDAMGRERPAPLFFVSPRQINYQIPPGTLAGRGYVTVASGNDQYSMGITEIVNVAPGLFAANPTGQGVAAGGALRVRADNSQTIEPLARFDAAQNRFVSVPLDLGPESDQVFLVVFGTGIRFRSSATAVTARIGGVEAPVSFAGAQGEFVGLDQANLRVSRSLIGRGEVDIALTADGRVANAVRVNFK